MSAISNLVHDPLVLGRVTRSIEEAIAKSFEGKHKMRHMTRAEVVRRFDMCVEIFCSLRADLKWGIDKILDHLFRFLDAKLDGRDWKPEARENSRTIWTPEDGP